MAEYEIIQPKVDLRKKINILPDSSEFDPIANAEEAMKSLESNFGAWMDDEIKEIQSVWARIEKDGLNEQALNDLFRSAHDLKGQSYTLGFPIVGLIAGSLCNLVENIIERDDLPMNILLKHVQAIVAVVKEDAGEEENPIGKALANELIRVSNDIVTKYTETHEESEEE